MSGAVATIQNAGSLSDAVPLGDEVITGIKMPSAWTAADLTFQVSDDGGATFLNLYDSAGSEIKVSVGASRFVAIDPSLWIGINHIKVRSGTSSGPVNQGGARTLVFATRR